MASVIVGKSISNVEKVQKKLIVARFSGHFSHLLSPSGIREFIARSTSPKAGRF